jgi:hypothetical protein
MIDAALAPDVRFCALGLKPPSDPNVFGRPSIQVRSAALHLRHFFFHDYVSSPFPPCFHFRSSDVLSRHFTQLRL